MPYTITTRPARIAAMRMGREPWQPDTRQTVATLDEARAVISKDYNPGPTFLGEKIVSGGTISLPDGTTITIEPTD